MTEAWTHLIDSLLSTITMFTFHSNNLFVLGPPLTWEQLGQHHAQDDQQNDQNEDNSEGKNPAAWLWTVKIRIEHEVTVDVRCVPLLPLCGELSCYSVTSVRCFFPLTFNSQDEALSDGHSQGLMWDAACILSTRVTERRLEIEESRQRVGLVLVVSVTWQQNVLEHLGERSTHPLARHCRALVPNYLHIQRIVLLCLTNNLLLLALLHQESGSNIEGDNGSLWGDDRITWN